MKYHLITIAILASALLSAACDSDDEKTQWIGAPCHCEGAGCEAVGVPLPAPVIDKDGNMTGTIVGCDDVSLDGIEGARIVCLQNLTAHENLAPPTYFPQGYCAISAVSCENNFFCSSAEYGDPTKMTTCPKGTVLIESTFEYDIAGMGDATIFNKTCAKACNSNDDCNTAGDMSCLNKNGHKFCYHEDNIKLLGNNVKYTDF
ncbi:MAG: hypothetical protein IJU23_03890 [Proteobacteria bacterium]|nr:hypothetical protein [Pseudomonadota bacterium]